MKIETQIQEDHQAKIIVEADNDQMEAMKHRAARKIARKVKIAGFRPGKAPYPVIVRQVGEAAILEEALEILVDDIYPKVIEEANINPYGPGSLENVQSMDPPILEFVVPLEAEVELGDYKSIRVQYEPEEVTQDDVDKVLANLRENQAIIEPVDRPSQIGDLVTVRISATKKNGENDGEVIIEERSTRIIISEAENDETDETPTEWPFNGFSNQLIGLSENDEKSIEHSFSDDNEAEEFRGVTANFIVKVENVKTRQLPELDADFIASLGEFDDLQALTDEIRTSLEAQAQQSYNQDYDEIILDMIIDQSTIKFPPQMLEREVDSVMSNFENRLKQQGLDLDLYLKTRNLDIDGLREEATPNAESNLKQTLILLEIAKAENLDVDPDRVQAQAQSTLNYYAQSLTKKEARKLVNQNVYGNLVTNIMADMLINRSMERFRDITRGIADEPEQDDQISDEKAQVVVENTDDMISVSSPQEDSSAVEIDNDQAIAQDPEDITTETTDDEESENSVE